MAIVHEVPKAQSWLARFMTADFCPGANRFVYWLKEPIGWFVLALAASCLIGLYFDPVGWTVAGAIALMISAGTAWPVIAIRAIKMELHPNVHAVHEGEPCDMIVSVRNRIPFPIWGLVVEGYLDTEAKPSDLERLPTAALASVPAWCSGDYRIKVQPNLRGHFPLETPNVACSFPFAIWTARKPLADSSRLTVWPTVHHIAGGSAFSDRTRSESGTGNRPGSDGDFIGIRPYRLGDRINQVHWVTTARTDSLMVTERGGPQTAVLDVWIDTFAGQNGESELNRRMRVAASVIASLHRQQVPVRIQIGDQSVREGLTDAVLKESWDLLAAVPKPGADCRRRQQNKTAAWITISGHPSETVVQMNHAGGAPRSGNLMREWRVPVECDLSESLRQFWLENGHADAAA